MFLLFSIVGMVGIPISLICLIVTVIRKKPKKKPLIALAVCFVAFCIAVTISPAPETPVGSSVAKAEKKDMNHEVKKETDTKQVEPEVQTEEPHKTPTEKPKKEEAPSEPEEKDAVEPASNELYSKPLKTGSYNLPSGIEVTYADNVRNDVTGNLRLSRIATSTPAIDFAMEYYNVMMSEGELHAVVNFSLNTTTCFNEISGLLFVDTYEYVPKEEHDAKQLFTGMHLESKTYSIETGEEIESNE